MKQLEAVMGSSTGLPEVWQGDSQLKTAQGPPVSSRPCLLGCVGLRAPVKPRDDQSRHQSLLALSRAAEDIAIRTSQGGCRLLPAPKLSTKQYSPRHGSQRFMSSPVFLCPASLAAAPAASHIQNRSLLPLFVNYTFSGKL